MAPIIGHAIAQHPIDFGYRIGLPILQRAIDELSVRHYCLRMKIVHTLPALEISNTGKAKTCKKVQIPSMGYQSRPTIPREVIGHIRYAAKHWPNRAICRHFGLCYSTVYAIVFGQVRAQVDPIKPDWWK